ncbi:MAG: polysaccharide deacetylase family protein [archaeon]
MRNCLTIDLESIAHRYVTEKRHLSTVERSQIETEENRRLLDGGRILLHTERILHLLKKYECSATFFVVGEVSEWYPALIDEIREEGHEVAYHSHTHTPLKSVHFLEEELEKSRSFIKKFRPRGFRAPQARITQECLAHLAKRGFVYDSSSYGSFTTLGMIEGVIEVPISTYSLHKDAAATVPRPLSLSLLHNLEIPFGSGYFISLISLATPRLVSRLIEKSNQKGCPSILCLHPWQLSNNIAGSISGASLSHLALIPYDVSCSRAFEYLVRNHNFFSIFELIEDMGGPPSYSKKNASSSD